MKYINVDQSISFDTFTKNKSKSIIDRLDKNGERYKMNISVKSYSKDSQEKTNIFEVNGSIKINKRGILIAKNKNKNPHLAVSKVLESLEKQIRRWTEKTERSRKSMGRSLKSVRDFKLEISR